MERPGADRSCPQVRRHGNSPHFVRTALCGDRAMMSAVAGGIFHQLLKNLDGFRPGGVTGRTNGVGETVVFPIRGAEF